MTDTIKEYITDNAITNAEQDNEAVDEFAKAMKEKLAKARAKGRKGWNDKETCSDETLAYLFHDHLQKHNEGNFIDLANFLMFLHIRGAKPDVLSLVKEGVIKVMTAESDLERQDMIIKCLNIDLDNKEKLLKAKDEEIERLKAENKKYMEHITLKHLSEPIVFCASCSEKVIMLKDNK
ncbi:hypothetical protein [Sulfuricurvum sp.]|uniref:hypothetical protein n=1 Tax=Sulfuricurvum sp. TaxID=2025608 RepID=UPI0026240605|nr:hypothetical protein [Sulfuricurvum sp.]MDD2267847.1 hypothetical protein [Sulfuricurvum sp.]